MTLKLGFLLGSLYMISVRPVVVSSTRFYLISLSIVALLVNIWICYVLKGTATNRLFTIVTIALEPVKFLIEFSGICTLDAHNG